MRAGGDQGAMADANNEKENARHGAGGHREGGRVDTAKEALFPSANMAGRTPRCREGECAGERETRGRESILWLSDFGGRREGTKGSLSAKNQVPWKFLSPETRTEASLPVCIPGPPAGCDSCQEPVYVKGAGGGDAPCRRRTPRKGHGLCVCCSERVQGSELGTLRTWGLPPKAEHSRGCESPSGTSQPSVT